jgi:hypothetical protein
VLDVVRVTAISEEQNRRVEAQKNSGSLEKAWRPFHDSFQDNLEEVTKSIIEGMKSSRSAVSLSNLDAAVALLHQLDKHQEADDILQFFVSKEPVEFWDPSRDPFLRGKFHPAVARVIDNEQKKAAVAVEASFNIEKELINAAQTFSNEKK